MQEVERMRIRTSSSLPDSPRPVLAAIVLAVVAAGHAAAAPPASLPGSTSGAPGRPAPAGTPAGGARTPRAVAADVVLRGGAVYTLNAVRSWAEAVAIRQGKIVYVGSDRSVTPFIGPSTRVLNLQGRMVLPSFQDSHIHPISGGIGQRQCSLYAFQTKEEYVRAVARYAAEHKDVPWIRGDGWSLAAFAPTGIPDKSLLDAVVSDRPVYLESSDGHSAWVNSKALTIAGITRDTPNPNGGRIDHDPKTGEPMGSLQDEAMGLVNSKAPPYTAKERQDGLRSALKMLNGFGITSFQDASVDTDALETYRALDEAGQLSARVVASLWWERKKGEEQIAGFLEARRKYTRGRLRATTVKIMQDGVMEVQTAAMLEPYKGKGNERGLEMVDPEALKKDVAHLDREGFQVHFHAIGDAAIRHCLDAVEAARVANGPRDSRHHISHLEIFNPADIPRFRALGVVANFQPLWAYADDYMEKLTLPFLEPERARWIYPIGSLYRSGAVVAFGSDWSVSSANPLEEIEVAVTRMGAAGETKEPFIPEERIDLPEALAAFTINAAYVNFQDERTGSIEVGKLADLIVLDKNLFTIKPEAISDAKVVLTLLGGQAVSGDLATLAMAGSVTRR
jgi:predicted amidohydrolase YtcJ